MVHTPKFQISIFVLFAWLVWKFKKVKELRNVILAIFFCSMIGICQIEANVEFGKINFKLD